jgi:hypothetical protein
MDGKEICDRLERGEFVNDPEVTGTIERLSLACNSLVKSGALAAAEPAVREYVALQLEFMETLKGTVTPENLQRLYQHMKKRADDEVAFAGRYNAEINQ